MGSSGPGHSGGRTLSTMQRAVGQCASRCRPPLPNQPPLLLDERVVLVRGRHVIDLPLELELDLLLVGAALVLDAELGSGGNADTLSRDLDAEGGVAFERVCEATQLGDDLAGRVTTLHVPGLPAHAFLPRLLGCAVRESRSLFTHSRERLLTASLPPRSRAA